MNFTAKLLKRRVMRKKKKTSQVVTWTSGNVNGTGLLLTFRMDPLVQRKELKSQQQGAYYSHTQILQN